MATYFPSSHNQSNVAPMLYSRDSFSYSETPVISGYMMMDIGGLPNGEQDFGSWGNNRNNEVSFLSPMGGATGVLQGVQNLQGQGLSLSLSTQIPSTFELPPIEYQNSHLGFSSFTCPTMSISSEGNENSPNKQLRNFDPMKADISGYGMSGIAGLIPNSKYLKVAQQLLDEVVTLRKATRLECRNGLVKSLKEDDGEPNNETTVPSANGSNSIRVLSAAEKQDLENKLMKLLSLLDEVDRRYKNYYHQMQIMVSSFDDLSGSGAANAYTSLALQAISRHFRCLRDAITGQVRATRRSLGDEEDDGSPTKYSKRGVGISRLRYLDQHLRKQRAVQKLGMMQQHSWRPQRGLPDSSVSVLRAWLFEHFLNPYPKNSEKIILARQAGLTRSQVSNWFINARVRLWKPMVEDMYKEEIGDASSFEFASQATKSDNMGSQDIGEDLQQNAISKQIEQLSHDGIQREDENGYGLVESEMEQRPSVDESNLFCFVKSVGGSGRFQPTAAAYHPISELGNGSRVSLSLGLHHCDEGNFVAMRDADDLYNAASSSLGPEAADFEHKFGSSNLLHDFVA